MENLSFDEAKSIVEKHLLPYRCVFSSEDNEDSIRIKIFYDNQNDNDFYLTGTYDRYRDRDSLAWCLQATQFGFQQELHDRNKSVV